ncbi:hypothetical protein SRHO_G00333810 [Serrasalmus rhombeus]
MQDDETSDSEYEEESDRSCSDSSEESKAAPVTPPQFVQKLIVFAAGLRLLLSTVTNTAGKVVVTILLGLAGIALPSLTSALYFGAFLSLVWCWVLGYSIDLLLFSTLCLMMTIFSGGHILILYLYQLPLFQQLVPPQDLYARLFGMTAFIHTNASEPYSLGLQADPVLMMLNSSWQDHNSSRLNSLPSDNGYPRCCSLLPYTQDDCSYADEGEPSRMVTILGAFIKGTLVKYWILCCCSIFFIISFSGKVVIYKILYICLFLFCVVLYQVHYEVWRRILKYFWAIVVGYSMLVLILIYVYQFKTVSSLFRQIIGISEEG